MITVLLADDNYIALEHFCSLVDWNELGFQIVTTAINGIDAYKKFEIFRPKLVITDIQMPGLNGCELAAKIRELDPTVTIIFLSSYNDFDYARSAIDLNVHDYILKQELSRSLLADKLTALRSLMQKRQLSSRKLIDHEILLTFKTPVCELQNSHFSAEWVSGKFQFFFLEQDHIPELFQKISGYSTPEADSSQLIPAIINSVPEPFYMVRIHPYRWVCLFCEDCSYEDNARKVKSLAELTFHCSFSLFLYPGKSASILQCREFYEKSDFLFEQRYFENPGAILYWDLYEKSEQKSSKSRQPFMPEKLDISFEDRNTAEYYELLQNYDYKGLMLFTENILLLLQKEIAANHLCIQLFDEEVQSLFTIRRMIRWIKTRIHLVREYINPSYSDATNKAINYISKEYANPLLSLEDIASVSGISVNRLNDLFKKELHQTVGRYLTGVRMKKARELLNLPGTKIPTAALLTGYSSSSYFAYVFRKTYGISPTDYQRRKEGPL